MRCVWTLGAAVCAPAMATDLDVGAVYVTPQIGYLRVDNERPTDEENVIGGLAFGMHLSPAWSAEILLDGTALDGDPGAPDFSLYSASREPAARCSIVPAIFLRIWASAPVRSSTT